MAAVCNAECRWSSGGDVLLVALQRDYVNPDRATVLSIDRTDSGIGFMCILHSFREITIAMSKYDCSLRDDNSIAGWRSEKAFHTLH